MDMQAEIAQLREIVPGHPTHVYRAALKKAKGVVDEAVCFMFDGDFVLGQEAPAVTILEEQGLDAAGNAVSTLPQESIEEYRRAELEEKEGESN